MRYPYEITFPRQPIDEVKGRVKGREMIYRKDLGPDGEHSGLPGTWHGDLSEDELDSLNLPAGTKITKLRPTPTEEPSSP